MPAPITASDPAAVYAPARVGEYFDTDSAFWKTVYNAEDVYSVIYQERLARVLSWIDRLALPENASALDVGCGAGLLSAALAQRRFWVNSVDLAPAMLAKTRELASSRGLSERVRTSQTDIRQMPFPDGAFDLTVALGVLPWAPSPEAAAREMARVLRPGGYLIVTVDNRWRFHELADPFAWASRFKNAIARRLSRWRGQPQPLICRRASIREADALLVDARLEIVRAATVGFGPFWSLRRWRPPAAGVAAHRRLQAWADRGMPILQSTGAHYIVLGRKRIASQ